MRTATGRFSRVSLGSSSPIVRSYSSISARSWQPRATMPMCASGKARRMRRAVSASG